jgi:hypothetical protein
VGLPHVRVGHRQALILKTLIARLLGFFSSAEKLSYAHKVLIVLV